VTPNFGLVHPTDIYPGTVLIVPGPIFLDPQPQSRTKNSQVKSHLISSTPSYQSLHHFNWSWPISVGCRDRWDFSLGSFLSETEAGEEGGGVGRFLVKFWEQILDQLKSVLALDFPNSSWHNYFIVPLRSHARCEEQLIFVLNFLIVPGSIIFVNWSRNNKFFGKKMPWRGLIFIVPSLPLFLPSQF